jgi:GNAT superfamily N-acetyltransferase
MQLTFARIPPNKSAVLPSYIDLFRQCFPKSNIYTEKYLTWLYWNNPEGNVTGYDAWDGDRLAAHYACIPITVSVQGVTVKSLLSLNTATHPQYQGKGLFPQLAELTYQAGADAGFASVVGVANANSTPGFIRKLGFTLISPLEAKIGFGGFSKRWSDVLPETEFRRLWTPSSLTWRAANPANPITLSHMDSGVIACVASAGMGWLGAYGEIPLAAADVANIPHTPRRRTVGRVFLGLFPGDKTPCSGYINIPNRLRPSPLNLIFRPLSLNSANPSSKKILLSFLDFDAF